MWKNEWFLLPYSHLLQALISVSEYADEIMKVILMNGALQSYLNGFMVEFVFV